MPAWAMTVLGFVLALLFGLGVMYGVLFGVLWAEDVLRRNRRDGGER